MGDNRTICEVSCRLVDYAAARQTGSTKGLAYPVVEVSHDQVQQVLLESLPAVHLTWADDSASAEEQAAASTSRPSWLLHLQGAAAWLQNRLWFSPGRGLGPQQLLAWHCTRQWLAAAVPLLGAVAVYDLDGAPATANGSVEVARVQEASWVLAHELQQQISCIAWRPVMSSMVAVGCCEGVALWSLGQPPLAGAAAQRQAAGGSAWVTFLHFKRKARVSGLAWSPDGRLLAGCSADVNRLVVWDVALGLGTSLRVSLAPNPMLAWSPDGNYMVVGGQVGSVFLCETSRWALRSWDLPQGASLVAAAWAPNARVVLLALSNSSSLIALHLVEPPPKLTEQMLPVNLPEVSNSAGRTSGGRSSSSSNESVIGNMVWDKTGQRLAVALKGPHPKAGSVALFSTSYEPVVTCNFIGYARAFPEVEEAWRDKQEQPSERDSGVEGVAAAAAGELGMELAFAPSCSKPSALLSIRRAGGWEISSVPMYI